MHNTQPAVAILPAMPNGTSSENVVLPKWAFLFNAIEQRVATKLKILGILYTLAGLIQLGCEAHMIKKGERR